MADLLTQQVARRQAAAPQPSQVEQNRALIQQLLARPTQGPGPMNAPPGLMQMGVGMLPGAGDVMAAQESQAAGQRMADAWRQGQYGQAAGAGLEAVGHGLGALPMVPAFMGAMVKAYHGSPHRFEPQPDAPHGKFSMEKIGTGEGAQAYGHGLYFAENPAIAGDYKRVLSDRVDPTVEGGGSLPSWVVSRIERGETDEMIAEFEKRVAEDMAAIADPKTVQPWNIESRLPNLQRIVEDLKRVKAGAKTQRPGALYNVSLDVEPEDLLDWDAALPRQSPKVKEALEKAGIREQMPNASGRAIYQALQDKLGGQAAASRALAEAGIPGLRYFDAGSRGKGEGSRNVVMFRDDKIKIEGVE